MVFMLAAALVAGCRIEPPLHLRKAVATKVVVETKVNLNVMWQVNWSAQWQFGWNVSALGPLGYKDPASMRLHIYTQDSDGMPVAHAIHNFVGSEASMEVFVGTHNLLFHNNDSEALLFKSDGDLEPIQCYTRQISKGLKSSAPVYTIMQKAAGVTKADDPEEEPVSLACEGGYVCPFLQSRGLSERAAGGDGTRETGDCRGLQNRAARNCFVGCGA